jgi:putative transposase
VIATNQGWLYLAVVIDLFSCRIVGWSMKTTIDRTLVCDALKMACLPRRPEAGKTIFTVIAAASMPRRIIVR